MGNSKFNPKVSIVIPVYNGSNYVRDAIDSALAQTYSNIEVIVVNDGSDDDGKTDEICRSYGKKIRYFKKKNGGVATALNKGIEKMTGEYFSWLSHDDVYYPNKIKAQVDFLSDRKNKKTIIYSGIEIIDENGKHIEFQDYSSKYCLEDLNKPLFPFFHLCLNGCAMLISKALFIKYGTFNENMPTVQDYDMWFRLLRNSEISYEGNILLKSRSHSKQGSKEFLTEHVKECNSFWLDVFSKINDKDISLLYKTKGELYADLYKTFSTLTAYYEVIDFLSKNLLEETLKIFPDFAKNSTEKSNLIKVLHSFYKNLSKENLLEIFNHVPKKKNRIAFFTLNWHDRGGLNNVVSKVSSMLSSYYEVFIVCMKEEGNDKGYEFDKKVEFIEIDKDNFDNIPLFMKMLGVDIFISTNNCLVPILKQYTKIESYGIKVIMWNHEHFFVPYYEDYLNESVLVRESVFNEVSVVLWLTEFSAKLGRMFCDRVGVMKNPVTLNAPKKLVNKRENRILVSVGRFNSPRKRLDCLLLVFHKVLQKIPNAKLFVVGLYDLEMKTELTNGRTLSSFINRLKIPKENLIFTGEVKDVGKYYEQSSVNIMTSEREGFGLTILESASYGIPSVVFGAGGMEDVFIDGKEGCVINDRNIDDMAEKIIDLLTDDNFYTHISKNSLGMLDRYKKEVILSNWLELIDGVLNLSKEDLIPFLKEKFSGNKGNLTEQNIKDIIVLYNTAIKKKLVSPVDVAINTENLVVATDQEMVISCSNMRLLYRKLIPLNIRCVIKRVCLFIGRIFMFLDEKVLGKFV